MIDLLLALLIGSAVGYFTPGHQDKKRLALIGVGAGIVIAIVLTLLFGLFGGAVGYGGAGAAFGALIGLAFFIGVVLLTVAFVVGVFLGDWLEHRGKA